MSTVELMSEARQKKVLAVVSAREVILRTQVRAVVQGYTNALFVFGPGGMGKTHTVTDELSALCGKTWVHHTAYSTPKALMMSLAEFPSTVHLFEDCEKLYKQDVASSILRAACGSPKSKARWVTYETAHEKLQVNFTGGVLIVSNEDLSRSRGPLAAVASRFRPIKWDLTIEERIALILSIAKEGWAKGKYSLVAKDATVVATFLVTQMTSGEVKVPVDLRTFTEHALPTYAQWKDAGGKGEGWKDVIASKLAGQVITAESRNERGGRLETLAFSLSSNKTMRREQRLAEWKEATGLGQAIYYRYAKRSKTK